MIACMKFVWKFKVQIHHLGADLLRMLSVGLQSSSHLHTVFSSSMLSILRDKSVRLARNLRATSARVARDSRATSARVARDSRYSQTLKKSKFLEYEELFVFVIARAIVKIQILKGKIMNFPIFDEKKLRGLSIHNCGRSQAPPNFSKISDSRGPSENRLSQAPLFISCKGKIVEFDIFNTPHTMI